MEYVQQLEQLVRAFNWHNPSWDLFILLFWIVASVIYAFAAGRGRIITVLLSVYMAKLLVLEAPFLSDEIAHRLNITVFSLQQLVTFGILFLTFFVLLSRYVFRTSVDGRGVISLPFALAFSVLQIGLLINVVLRFLPTAAQENFAPLIRFAFLDSPSSFVWLVAPLIFLMIMGRFISDRTET